MSDAEPVPFMTIRTPERLKAFTDPLRVRILIALKGRPATNQQVAAALGEPPAKVLHHIRFLLDAGLIRLVDTQIKGGNVEKYYRATAHLYALRPPAGDEATGHAGAMLQAVQQEVTASELAWPDQRLCWELRGARLPQPRADEFYERLLALIAEYWGGPALGQADETVRGPEEDPAA
ncbi:MAG TPA: helix-turn-helix domain-containing protein, partial [Thermomicrobiales bacterium]|nr:helix-turn-helix domain-containing protein [Thermomicrobiales bacterium]